MFSRQVLLFQDLNRGCLYGSIVDFQDVCLIITQLDSKISIGSLAGIHDKQIVIRRASTNIIFVSRCITRAGIFVLSVTSIENFRAKWSEKPSGLRYEIHETTAGSLVKPKSRRSDCSPRKVLICEYAEIITTHHTLLQTCYQKNTVSLRQTTIKSPTQKKNHWCWPCRVWNSFSDNTFHSGLELVGQYTQHINICWCFGPIKTEIASIPRMKGSEYCG